MHVVGLYNQIKYVNWIVATQPTGGVVPSIGTNYITSGPTDGALKAGQLLFQISDNSDIIDIHSKYIGYSCSSLGGLTAVPCTIRLHITASPIYKSSVDTIDLVYTRKQASTNKFATYDFTGNGHDMGWEHISFELISADNPSSTQVNFDAFDYMAQHYK